MNSKLRIGYSFWGFIADRKFDADGRPTSSPDGNATYSWSIVWEAMRRGHTVVPLQQERDAPGISQFGINLFRSFSQRKRTDAYSHLIFGESLKSKRAPGGWVDGTGELGVFPELDVVLLEWRFPIPGRNTPEDKGKPGYQQDLERQTELLEHYRGTKTKVILWDLDHRLTGVDETLARCDAVFETSVLPRKTSCIPRVRVEPPFVIDDLLQHPTREGSEIHIAYVGSRYERDEQVDEWIGPYAKTHPGRVHFYGKWEPKDEVYGRWPGIVFHDRITMVDFKDAYSAACAVPILAKQSYRESGFITPRVHEAILFGSIPIGLRGHLGIEEYCKVVAETPRNLEHCVLMMREMDLHARDTMRRHAAERLSFTDASRFVDSIEAVVG